MSRDERDNLQIKKMLDEIAVLESFITGLDSGCFHQSIVVQRAVVMTIINIGEISKKLSDAMQQKMSSVPWQELRGLRNLAAHQYGAVNMTRVWRIITQDLPELKSTLLYQQSEMK